MVSMVSDGSNDNETTLNDDAQFGLRQLNPCKSKGWSPAIRTRSFGAVNATTSATISTLLIPNTGTFPDPVPGSKIIRSARGPFHCLDPRRCRNDVDYRVDSDNVNINYLDLRYAGWKPWAGSWTI